MDSSLIAIKTAPTVSLAAYPGAMQVADVLDWGFSLYRSHPCLIWPLTLLGSLPVMISFILFYYFFAVLKYSPLVATGPFQSVSIWALWLTGLIFWRTIIMGAQTIAIDRIFTGYPVKASLSGALKKGGALCALAAVQGAFFILSAVFLFIPYLLLGGSFYPSLSLVALEGMSPWRALSTIRGAGGFSRRCFWVYLLILLLWLIAAVNILLGLYWSLGLLHSVFDINVSYWQTFLSPSNRIYLLLVLGAGFLLTEPLRAATGWLLYNDYKVRQEGYDLRQMVDRLIRSDG